MEPNVSHTNLYLCILSSLGSVTSFMLAHATKDNVSWFIGCAAGVVAIIAGIMTIREKRLNIRALNEKARRNVQAKNKENSLTQKND